MKRFRPAVGFLRLAAAAAVATILCGGAACSRAAVYADRVGAIASDPARAALREALWAHGSLYRWADYRVLRCEVEWSEPRPLATTTRRAVWLLDTERGRLRIEHPAAQEVVLFDGLAWHFAAGGREMSDGAARMHAAGEARVARELVPLPFSLLEAGLEIGYLGHRDGPAEARSWDQLLVAYRDGTGHETADRLVVEIRRETHRVEAVVLQWPELPFADRRYRVELDDWRPEGDVVLAHRFRFYPADASGRRAGDLRLEVRVTRMQWDTPVDWTTFSRP